MGADYAFEALRGARPLPQRPIRASPEAPGCDDERPGQRAGQTSRAVSHGMDHVTVTESGAGFAQVPGKRIVKIKLRTQASVPA